IAGLTAAWRRRLGIRRPVRVVLAEGHTTPFTMGLLRPAIVLPAGAAAWSPARLEAVLAHELGHVARLDILWLRLENLAQTLFFFHPAAWIAPRRLGRLRELLCDRLVLSGPWLDAEPYARSLLETLRAAPAGGPSLQPAAPALAETREGLEMRLHAITTSARGLAPRLSVTLAVLALLGGLLLPMAPARAQPASAAAPSPAPRAADGNPIHWTRDRGLTEPRKISAPAPVYPDEARKQRIQGTVVLQALIGTDGAIHDLKVLRPMPGGLTEAAEEAVRQWRFEPARNAAGQAVPVRYTLTVRFVLSGETPHFSPDSGLTEPRKIRAVAPVYPEKARRQGIQGTVVFDALIGTDGSVHDLKVLQSQPAGLTGAAEAAVRQWRFEPARNARSEPVAVRYKLTVRFRLAR
ncbi:MAG: M56 family metallopeptidase, partial [Acidobacteria bacterium]|nr:M56 family metallopeptidase [Acidobacteriota bacterium]